MKAPLWPLLLGLSLAAPAIRAADPPAAAGGSHGAIPCATCHPPDGTVDCSRCHGPEHNPHPVGVALTTEAPAGLFLGPENQILCRTCHQIHGGDPERRYVVANGDACFPSRRRFCAACHPSGSAEIDPHDASAGGSRCHFCHGDPNYAEGLERGTVSVPVNRLCRFCHGTADDGHWENLGLISPLPEPLPLDGNGEQTCATCHQPHGTADTVFFLRRPLVRALGRSQESNPHVENYFACRACHATSFADQIAAPDYRLLYGGDRLALCLSCHVMTQAHHPVGVGLDEAMGRRLAASGIDAPLDAGGRIDCSTCHASNCAGDQRNMQVRAYDPVELRNDLCWGCHDRSAFADHNPHSSAPDQCRWCHEARPSPGGGGQHGLLADPTMVCLQCHRPEPHPAGTDHLVVPPARVQVGASLPVREDGKIVCVTCHLPHVRTQGLPQRLRENSRRLCSLCHRGQGG